MILEHMSLITAYEQETLPSEGWGHDLSGTSSGCQRPGGGVPTRSLEAEGTANSTVH